PGQHLPPARSGSRSLFCSTAAQLPRYKPPACDRSSSAMHLQVETAHRAVATDARGIRSEASSFPLRFFRVNFLPGDCIEKREARSTEESARGAAQAGCVLNARPVQPRDLRRQSTRPSQARELVFPAFEIGPGRFENARPARRDMEF